MHCTCYLLILHSSLHPLVIMTLIELGTTANGNPSGVSVSMENVYGMWPRPFNEASSWFGSKPQSAFKLGPHALHEEPVLNG